MRCIQCPKDAIIYLRDLKHKKKPTAYLCEEHFEVFCKSLIDNKIKYNGKVKAKTHSL